MLSVLPSNLPKKATQRVKTNSKRQSSPWVYVVLLLGSSLFSIVLLEALGQIGYRISKGEWLFLTSPLRTSNYAYAHPWLVISPKPNVAGTIEGLQISHNSYGSRGPEFNIQKAPGITRIVALGGSSTYGVGVSDHETWPVHLQHVLGEEYEVINLGVMGYTTAEHIIQTALTLSDLAPDIALYYEGWNDARNSHVANLGSDYVDFHGRSQYYTHAMYEFPHARWSFLALAVKKSMRFVRNPYDYRTPEGGTGKYTPEPDHRALGIYEKNLRLLAALCREQNIKPFFLPQVMNREHLTQDNVHGWLPFVKDKDLPKVIDYYNGVMQKTAEEENVPFVARLLAEEFSIDDFGKGDAGHFNAQGNLKFAKILAQEIRKQSESPSIESRATTP